jgi:hypothetical protein
MNSASRTMLLAGKLSTCSKLCRVGESRLECKRIWGSIDSTICVSVVNDTFAQTWGLVGHLRKMWDSRRGVAGGENGSRCARCALIGDPTERQVGPCVIH